MMFDKLQFSKIKEFTVRFEEVFESFRFNANSSINNLGLKFKSLISDWTVYLLIILNCGFAVELDNDFSIGNIILDGILQNVEEDHIVHSPIRSKILVH